MKKVFNEKDYIGKRYGMLTVVAYAGKGRNNLNLLKCACDCGNEKIVSASSLNSGSVSSCGCLGKKNHERLANLNKTHGESKTRLYKIWQGMKSRCLNPNRPKYARYGGRGIKVCDEWVNSFEAFKSWALENGYNDTLTIERNDVNGNYEPSNCCWIPPEEQKDNKEKTIYLSYEGEVKPLVTWAKEKGLNEKTLHVRHRKGWTDKEVIEGRKRPWCTKNQIV